MDDFSVRILNQLGINADGSYQSGKYIVELEDSNEFSKMYTLLDNSDVVEIDDFATLITDKVTELTFDGDNFKIKLVGNFITNMYRLVITEE